MKMNMNDEIKKYQGHIYYFDRSSHEIKSADWIESIYDYNHTQYELHHVVPYTDWEKNTKGVQGRVSHNALILIPKVMHQQLENPVFKLSKDRFKDVYGINPDVILYDINSRLERTADLFYENKQKKNSELTLNDLSESDIECLGG